MARLTKEERLREVHAEGVKRLNDAYGVVYDLRQECLSDRRFYSIAGAQYEDPNLSARFANKPRMEFNKTHRAVMRVISEMRNNQIDVVFVPSNGKDETGMVEKLNGLWRADKQDSHGDEAFRNACEEAIGGGFGAFRLYSEYEDESDPENEHQRICFEPITDADQNVFFDLNSKRQDKSDAKWCMVLVPMTPAAFQEEWGNLSDEEADDGDQGNANLSSLPHAIEQKYFDWSTTDVVYVGEYYVIETVKKRYEVWTNDLGDEEQYEADELREREEEDETPTKLEELIATGWRYQRTRTIKVKQVHKYILSGDQVLEDCGVIAGPNIPIIPVYGMRWFIDGVERYMGRVRMAKDAQRLLNMNISRIAEQAAISPIPVPVFAPEQIDEFRPEWEDNNIVNHPYLRANTLKDKDGNPIALGPLAMLQAPDLPAANVALTQYLDVAMQDLLGTRQDTQKIRSNISAETVQLVQNDLDMDSYIFIDNGALSLQRAGEVYFGMLRVLYTESGRRMKTIGQRGEVGSLELMKPMSGDSGTYYENDFTLADMDVTTVIGPASRTRQDAIVRTMVDLLPATQQTGNPADIRNVLGTIIMNLEAPGIGDLKEYYRKEMVKIGSAQPTEEEAKAMAEAAQNQQPDAQTQWALAAAQKEQALAQKAQADMMQALANVEKIRAETGKTWAEALDVAEGIDVARKDMLLRMLQMFEAGQVAR